MKRAVIYGATDTGKRVYKMTKDKYRILSFVDENLLMVGNTIEGIEIKDVGSLKDIKYDYIIVAVLSRYKTVTESLISQGIDERKIITKYVDLPNRAREAYVENLSIYLKEHCLDGAIAELGVYQGEFSKVIGEKFKNNRFYLFDTFEGFSEKDVTYETENNYSPAKDGYFSNTSVDSVLDKIPNNSRCVVKKGYFPDTANDVNDEFIFVNLDADLYKPTIEGLHFFWNKMKLGGVILIHDYFSDVYTGVNKAVNEFCIQEKIYATPIGDTLSVALIKNI